jgi:hypothetical protein
MKTIHKRDGWRYYKIKTISYYRTKPKIPKNQMLVNTSQKENNVDLSLHKNKAD